MLWLARRKTRIAGTVALIAVAASALAWRWLDNPDRLFRNALLAAENEDLGSLERALYKLELRPAYSMHAGVLRGALRLKQGKAAEALREFYAISPEGSARHPAMYWTAACLFGLHRNAEAERLLQQLLAERPEHLAGRLLLSSVLYARGAIHEATAELDELMLRNPADYRFYQLRGGIAYESLEDAKALEYYQAALDRHPPESEKQSILLAMAQAALTRLDHETALKAISQARPTALTEALSSICHLALGDAEAAWRDVTHAAELDDQERMVGVMQARLLVQRGHPEEAVSPLLRRLEREPHDSEARYQLALVYQQLGRDSDFKAEIALKQQSEELLNLLVVLNRRATHQPQNPEVREQLAEICTKLGRTEQAATWRLAANACRQLATERPPDG